ncbi:MAG: Dot/Icm type IV secretion system effector PhnB [Roseivirga sp.]
MPVNPIPKDYPRASPFLMVTDINKEADFLTTVFDAVETERIQLPDGTVKHVELRIGDSVIMLGEDSGRMGAMNSMVYLYVEDTAATYEKALAAGATAVMPPGEQFYGDINAGIRDSFGHYWWLATHVEDLTEDEMNERAAAFYAK